MATTVGDIIFLGDPPHEMPMTQSAATRVAERYVELLLDLDTRSIVTMPSLSGLPPSYSGYGCQARQGSRVESFARKTGKRVEKWVCQMWPAILRPCGKQGGIVPGSVAPPTRCSLSALPRRQQWVNLGASGGASERSKG
jgi:hypothetical protein